MRRKEIWLNEFLVDYDNPESAENREAKKALGKVLVYYAEMTWIYNRVVKVYNEKYYKILQETE